MQPKARNIYLREEQGQHDPLDLSMETIRAREATRVFAADRKRRFALWVAQEGLAMLQGGAPTRTPR